jgi:TPR repeat protein
MFIDDSGYRGFATIGNITVESVQGPAEEGDAAAQFKYGLLLEKGAGIAKDTSLAAHYYKLSADQGYADAQFHYGLLLFRGDGIEKDKSLGAHYYKLSADQGYADAQLEYALLLDGGDGIGMDKLLATHYYKLAADQGNGTAQCRYGMCLHMGDIIPMDKSLAAHYYKLSADQGDWMAYNNYKRIRQNLPDSRRAVNCSITYRSCLAKSLSLPFVLECPSHPNLMTSHGLSPQNRTRLCPCVTVSHGLMQISCFE